MLPSVRGGVTCDVRDGVGVAVLAAEGEAAVFTAEGEVEDVGPGLEVVLHAVVRPIKKISTAPIIKRCLFPRPIFSVNMLFLLLDFRTVAKSLVPSVVGSPPPSRWGRRTRLLSGYCAVQSHI